MTTEHIPPRQKPRQNGAVPYFSMPGADHSSGREGCKGGEAPDGGGPEERSSRRATWSASQGQRHGFESGGAKKITGA
jgi:hypothetical protein